MIYNVRLRIPSSPHLTELLAILGHRTIYFYCNEVIDEFIIKGPVDPKSIQKIGKLSFLQNAEIVNNEGKICYILTKCESNNTNHLMKIRRELFKNQFFIVSYVQQLGEWQYYTTITFSDENIANFVSDSKIRPIEILSTKGLPGFNLTIAEPYLEVKDIVANLTETQLSVLLQAVDGGYYEIPRRISLPEVAKNRGISRSALEKSFRTAEKKVMYTIINSIYQYLGRTHPERSLE